MSRPSPTCPPPLTAAMPSLNLHNFLLEESFPRVHGYIVLSIAQPALSTGPLCSGFLSPFTVSVEGQDGAGGTHGHLVVVSALLIPHTCTEHRLCSTPCGGWTPEIELRAKQTLALLSYTAFTSNCRTGRERDNLRILTGEPHHWGCGWAMLALAGG